MPTWRSYSTSTAYSNATNWTINKPANVADGDLLLAAFSMTNALYLFSIVPTGWQLLEVFNYSTYQLRIYWKVASGEGASWTWVNSSNASGGAQVHAFYNTDPVNPIVVTRGQAQTWSTSTAPSVSPAINDTMLVTLFASRSTNFAASTPAGMTERSDVNYNNLRGLAVCTEDRPTAGATAARSSTITSFTGSNVGYSIIIKGNTSHPALVSSSNRLTSSSTSVVVDKPYGIIGGDLLIAAFINTSTSITGVPSGWTLLQSFAFSTETVRVYYKIASSSETSSWTWTSSTAATGVAECYAFRDADGVHASAVGTTGTTYLCTAPTITPSSATDLFLFIFGSISESAGVMTENSSGSVYLATEITDITSGTSRVLSAAYRLAGSTSASGTQVAGLNTFIDSNRACSIVIKTKTAVATLGDLFFGNDF